MPEVSVVMIFHRVSSFMQAAVGSVLNQTHRDLELILVDNGSGAGADAFGDSGRDPRIRWVRLATNEGIPGGHNAGIAVAQGEYVALLDYDDIALPARLEKQLATLRADPRLGLVSCCAERIDATGAVVGREFSLIEAAAQRTYTQYISPVVTPAYAGRREVFLQLPYRLEFPLAADYDFLARAAERWTMRGVPEVLLHYRWHATQTTQTKAAEMEQSFCAIRVLTARRRSGRSEEFASAVATLADPPPKPAESCRRAAQRCLAEGFHSLAAYHARRMFVLERRGPILFAAVRLATQAILSARGSERQLAARLFAMGPVRAHRLRPV